MQPYTFPLTTCKFCLPRGNESPQVGFHESLVRAVMAERIFTGAAEDNILITPEGSVPPRSVCAHIVILHPDSPSSRGVI